MYLARLYEKKKYEPIKLYYYYMNLTNLYRKEIIEEDRAIC